MKKDDQLSEYRRVMGQEAADRQAKLAAEKWSCCGAKRDGPHAPLCKKGRR